MKRIAFLCLLVACRERGTIEIGPSDALQACLSATDAMPAEIKISATFVPDGECGSCGCNSDASCPDCDTAMGCKQICPQGCTRDELEEGFAYEPPSSGSYAAVLRYKDASNIQIAVVCIKIDVDADGTQSKMQFADPNNTHCCQ